MNLPDTYKTIQNSSEGLFKDKGSKFLAFAYPVSDEESIRTILTEIRKQYHDARHHCFAYQIGVENQQHRVNDDGEPSGTAGKPIYGQIQSFGLTNILIVVVRYFGGILLGTGGLTNAYRMAAADALKNAEIIEKTVEDHLQIRFPYEVTREVTRIISRFNANIQKQQFGEDCIFDVLIRKSQTDRFIENVSQIKNVTVH